MKPLQQCHRELTLLQVTLSAAVPSPQAVMSQGEGVTRGPRRRMARCGDCCVDPGAPLAGCPHPQPRCQGRPTPVWGVGAGHPAISPRLPCSSCWLLSPTVHLLFFSNLTEGLRSRIRSPAQGHGSIGREKSQALSPEPAFSASKPCFLLFSSSVCLVSFLTFHT